MTDVATSQEESSVVTRRARLLARVEAILACPACHLPFGSRPADGHYVCRRCGATGERTVDQLRFGGFSREELGADWLNRRKEGAKRLLGRLYPAAITVLSPVHGPVSPEQFVRSFETSAALVIDLGSGATSYADRVACVDGAGYPNVHVVSPLEALPFADASVDGIISMAVLEHVPDPAAQVAEMRRVLRPGGRVFCFVPFIQGFHASPSDYQRYTQSGLRALFRDFDVVDVKVGSGPTSGMLWILQEWLAILMSFGSARLYRAVMPLTWILSPLKYLDVLLARHPAASVIASGNVILARKPQ